MKNFKKILSLVIACTFFVNNIAYGLSPGIVSGGLRSNGNGVKEAMYAGAQKLFAANRGPGAINFGDYKPTKFSGAVPEIPGLKFVPVNYDKLPNGWELNPILHGQLDLVSEFKLFREKEALIDSSKLPISEAYYDLNGKNAGEIPLARIENIVGRANDEYQHLAIHTDFVQMWNDIKQNDVWFEYVFEDGQTRTASLAWAIFYRVAKHEMMDLKKPNYKDPFLHAKGGGHAKLTSFDGLTVRSDENLANFIDGRYATINDAAWLWFLGSYCFGETTQYDNDTLKKRLQWFFSDESGLASEFPELDAFPSKREAVINLALAINGQFYTKYRKTPVSAQDLAKRQRLMEEYNIRKPHISTVIPATGKDEEKSVEQAQAAPRSRDDVYGFTKHFGKTPAGLLMFIGDCYSRHIVTAPMLADHYSKLWDEMRYHNWPGLFFEAPSEDQLDIIKNNLYGSDKSLRAQGMVEELDEHIIDEHPGNIRRQFRLTNKGRGMFEALRLGYAVETSAGIKWIMDAEKDGISVEWDEFFARAKNYRETGEFLAATGLGAINNSRDIRKRWWGKKVIASVQSRDDHGSFEIKLGSLWYPPFRGWNQYQGDLFAVKFSPEALNGAGSTIFEFDPTYFAPEKVEVPGRALIGIDFSLAQGEGKTVWVVDSSVFHKLLNGMAEKGVLKAEGREKALINGSVEVTQKRENFMYYPEEIKVVFISSDHPDARHIIEAANNGSIAKPQQRGADGKSARHEGKSPAEASAVTDHYSVLPKDADRDYIDILAEKYGDTDEIKNALAGARLGKVTTVQLAETLHLDIGMADAARIEAQEPIAMAPQTLIAPPTKISHLLPEIESVMRNIAAPYHEKIRQALGKLKEGARDHLRWRRNTYPLYGRRDHRGGHRLEHGIKCRLDLLQEQNYFAVSVAEESNIPVLYIMYQDVGYYDYIDVYDLIELWYDENLKTLNVSYKYSRGEWPGYAREHLYSASPESFNINEARKAIKSFLDKLAFENAVEKMVAAANKAYYIDRLVQAYATAKKTLGSRGDIVDIPERLRNIDVDDFIHLLRYSDPDVIANVDIEGIIENKYMKVYGRKFRYEDPDSLVELKELMLAEFENALTAVYPGYYSVQSQSSAGAVSSTSEPQLRDSDGKFTAHPGKSPIDLLMIIWSHSGQFKAFTASVLLDEYEKRYVQFGFEAPAKKRYSAIRTIKRDLAILCGAGIIERVPGGRGMYIMTKNGTEAFRIAGMMAKIRTEKFRWPEYEKEIKDALSGIMVTPDAEPFFKQGIYADIDIISRFDMKNGEVDNKKLNIFISCHPTELGRTPAVPIKCANIKTGESFAMTLDANYHANFMHMPTGDYRIEVGDVESADEWTRDGEYLRLENQLQALLNAGRDPRIAAHASPAPIAPQKDRGFRHRAGKSPIAMLRLIANYIKEGDIITAPLLSGIYNDHWQEFGFEKLSENHLRTVERDLYESENSLLNQGLVSELLWRGQNGERRFILTARGATAALAQLIDRISWFEIAAKDYVSRLDNSTISETVLKDRLADITGRFGKFGGTLYAELEKMYASAVVYKALVNMLQPFSSAVDIKTGDIRVVITPGDKERKYFMTSATLDTGEIDGAMVTADGSMNISNTKRSWEDDSIKYMAEKGAPMELMRLTADWLSTLSMLLSEARLLVMEMTDIKASIEALESVKETSDASSKGVKEYLVNGVGVCVAPDRDIMGLAAARKVWANVTRLLKSKKGPVSMVLASAPSQREALAHFADMINEDFRKGNVSVDDLRRIHTFHLDQYAALENRPDGNRNYEQECDFAKMLSPLFFDHLVPEAREVIKGNFHSINSVGKGLSGEALEAAAKEECERYAAEVRNVIGQDGNFDIVIFGIGDENGHIAFNEPDSPTTDINNTDMLAPVKVHPAQQVSDGMFAKESHVPKLAVTMGLHWLIKRSNMMVGLIPGASKSNAANHVFYGEMTGKWPASFIRLNGNVTAYLDSAAASDMVLEEPPVASSSKRNARLSDLAPHPIVDALLSMIIDYSKTREGLEDPENFLKRYPASRLYLIGGRFSDNTSFLDIFNKLVRVHAMRAGRKNPGTEDKIAVCNALVRHAGYQHEVASRHSINETFVKKLEERLALQIEHFGVEEGNIYLMGGYHRHIRAILAHVRLERAIHKWVINSTFWGNIDNYRLWRKGALRPVEVGTEMSYKEEMVLFQLHKRVMKYNEFAELAHKVACDLPEHKELMVFARKIDHIPGYGIFKPGAEVAVAALIPDETRPGPSAPLMAGKSPADALTLAALYMNADDIITAPVLRDLYIDHWKELGFEEPAKEHNFVLRTEERNLYKSKDSLLNAKLVEELPKRGVNDARQFKLTKSGKRAAITAAMANRNWVAMNTEPYEALSIQPRKVSDTQFIESEGLIVVIDDYIARVDKKKGPGRLVLGDMENIYKSVSLLHESSIEIFIPQNVKLTGTMKKVLADIRKREGRDVIKCREFSSEDNLKTLLSQQAPNGVKRIVISEEAMDSWIIGIIAENPNLFLGVRLYNVALPHGYDKMKADEKNIYQAKMLNIAILARLFEKDKTPAVEALLKDMLTGCVGVGEVDVRDFINGLPESDDEVSDTAKITLRIMGFLNRIVRLTDILARDLRLMKEFWTAA
ncbi:MAG: 6-phosphogluconolactonase [Candidatus Omnitrophica bacterium]|nr:6-phosphogluconolactonase [Candidatus Omnitrophota bacterium]